MLNVIKLSVLKLNVVAPLKRTNTLAYINEHSATKKIFILMLTLGGEPEVRRRAGKEERREESHHSQP
jgi:hypothetical protein